MDARDTRNSRDIGGLEVTNIDRLVASFEQAWAPRVVALMNDWAIKVARFEGEYVWHAHADTAEVFLVTDGTIEIDLRGDDGERSVRLGPNDVFVVPRGVEHRPRSTGRGVVLMVEPADTLSTGDYAGEVPTTITSTTGI